MTGEDVPDSTDWLPTPLSALSAVENALRCQVCKDFYKTPMITSCCHTFCSLCIRRALANDGKCPLCRSTEQELKLRSNWSMEEAVEAFVKARPSTLTLAQNSNVSESLGKRKADDATSSLSSDHPEGKRLRTSARLRKNRVEPTEVQTIPDSDDDYEEVQEEDIRDDGNYIVASLDLRVGAKEVEDGLVPCPVCQSRMKEWQVFKHLESCPGPSTQSSRSSRPVASSPFGQASRQQSRTLERLPAVNYSMLREQALRKKLAEIGIPTQGPRALLEKRHKEWITLWNANCDAARPKKRAELLHDLDVWERTQGGRVTAGRSLQSVPMVKDKDFDGEAWSVKHNSSFQDLIASARKSRLEAKKKTDEAAKTPDEKPTDTAENVEESRPDETSSTGKLPLNFAVVMSDENDISIVPPDTNSVQADMDRAMRAGQTASQGGQDARSYASSTQQVASEYSIPTSQTSQVPTYASSGPEPLASRPAPSTNPSIPPYQS